MKNSPSMQEVVTAVSSLLYWEQQADWKNQFCAYSKLAPVKGEDADWLKKVLRHHEVRSLTLQPIEEHTRECKGPNGELEYTIDIGALDYFDTPAFLLHHQDASAKMVALHFLKNPKGDADDAASIIHAQRLLVDWRDSPSGANYADLPEAEKEKYRRLATLVKSAISDCQQRHASRTKVSFQERIENAGLAIGGAAAGVAHALLFRR